MSQGPDQKKPHAKDPVGDLMIEYFRTNELFREAGLSIDKPGMVVIHFAYRNIRISGEVALSLTIRLEALNCVKMAGQIRRALDLLAKRKADAAALEGSP